jgi:flagellin
MNLGSSLEKLSSGLRINRASDDAGGLAISEALRSQVRGIAMAEKNAQDGLGMINQAESVLDTVHEMLQRARELAVQSANGAVNNTQRIAMQAEITEIEAEVTRLGAATEFNGTQVFQATQVLQVGADNQGTDHQISVTTDTLVATAVGTSNVDMTAGDILSAANARTAITTYDNAITSVSLQRSTLGAQANRLEYTITSLQTARENIAAAESRIRDVDMATEMTNLTRNQILLQSSTAMVAQANMRPQTVLGLLR